MTPAPSAILVRIDRDAILDRIENRNEFLGILVLDKWTGNADARQSIFVRARLREYVPSFQGHALRTGFLALMVDHGYIFNGPHWSYADSPSMTSFDRSRKTPMRPSCTRRPPSRWPWIARSIAARR